QIAVARKVLGAKARLRHPDMAAMGEDDALRRPGRARGVEEHRGLVGAWHDCRERTWIEETIEALGAVAAETDDRNVGRAVFAARRIAEHELGAGIAQDEVDRRRRKFEIDRDGKEPCAGDAEKRR